MTAPADWLLLSVKYSTGDFLVWWGPNSSGYTYRLDDAGRYSAEEADRIEKSTHGSAVAVPLSDVIDHAVKVVPIRSFAREWFQRGFAAEKAYVASLNERTPRAAGEMQR